MENPEKLISDLYALRVGLSWISWKRNDADKIERQYQNGCNAVRQQAFDSVMTKFQNSPDAAEEERFGALLKSGELERNYEERLRAVEQEIAERNYKIKKPGKGLSKKQLFWGIFLLVLGIVAIATSLTFTYIYTRSMSAWYYHLLLWVLAIAIYGLPFICPGSIKIHRAQKARGAVRNAASQRCRFLKQERAALLAVPEMIQTRTSALTALANTRSNDLAPLQILADTAYGILVEQYGKILTPRDWQYLDLVIYYLETYRAKDIREALQLVDRERQTQQIVSSIKDATNSICRTIKSEMSSMRAELQEGISSLQKNLEIGFSSLRTSLDANNELLKQRVSQADITNALLERANVTSEKLMQDVSYLRSNQLKTTLYY